MKKGYNEATIKPVNFEKSRMDSFRSYLNDEEKERVARNIILMQNCIGKSEWQPFTEQTYHRCATCERIHGIFKDTDEDVLRRFVTSGHLAFSGHIYYRVTDLFISDLSVWIHV
jgi:hypothetical protein